LKTRKLHYRSTGACFAINRKNLPETKPPYLPFVIDGNVSHCVSRRINDKRLKSPGNIHNINSITATYNKKLNTL